MELFNSATAADEKCEIWTTPFGIMGREGGNFSPPCAASNGSNSLNRADVEGEMWVLKGHPPPSSACLAKTWKGDRDRAKKGIPINLNLTKRLFFIIIVLEHEGTMDMIRLQYT